MILPPVFRRGCIRPLSGLAVVVLGACSSSDRTPPSTELSATAVRLFQPDTLLYDVRHVVAGHGGEAWALSGVEPYVWRFDAQGRVAARFGRQGRGPGELLNPWGLTLAPDEPDGIAVWDVSARQMVKYDGRGGLRGALPLPLRSGTVRGDIRQVTYGEPFRLREAAGGWVVQLPQSSVTQTRDLYGSVLVRVGPDGVPRDTLSRFRLLLPRNRAPHGRVLVAIPLWAACADGRVAVFDPETGAVRWYGERGDQGSVTVPVERRALTDDDRRRYLSHVMELETRAAGARAPTPAEVNQVLAQARRQFGDEAPPAVEMLCDPRGRLWLEQFSTVDDPLGYGREWRVYDRGRWMRTVRFPAGFRPTQLLERRALGVQTDSDGVQRPATLALPAEVS